MIKRIKLSNKQKEIIKSPQLLNKLIQLLIKKGLIKKEEMI